MLAFAIFIFAVGAALAVVVSVRQFAIGALLLGAAGFAQSIHVGVPVRFSVLGAFGYFFCSQLGYVAGVGARALFSPKTKRSGRREALTRTLGEGHEPLIR